MYITNKNRDSSTEDSEDSGEVTISYDEIMLGKSLSMGEEEYFVIYYDKSDEDISAIYDEIVSSYRSKEDVTTPLYFVKMGSGFNKSFATEGEANQNPESIQDFSIHGPTLIRVEGQKVSDYVEGEDSIRGYLN